MAGQKYNRLIPFSEASKVTLLGEDKYLVNLHASYNVGSVPNGGYVASCLIRAASLHLGPRDQPHALTSHFSFLSRTNVGPAVIAIDVVKNGRSLSTLHVTLYQGGLLTAPPFITPGTSQKLVVGYITMADVHAERGVTIPFQLPLYRPPPPQPDFAALIAGRDAEWGPFVAGPGCPHLLITSLRNVQVFTPRGERMDKNVGDFWVRFAAGEGFTTEALAFVMDCLPPHIVEGNRPAVGQSEPFEHDAVFWYPTVVMNIELKKAFPNPGGVEWLRLRLQSKQVRNGRLDFEVHAFDANEDLVAIANNVTMIMSMARNQKGRI